jgi:hypothetical protein
MTLGECGAMLAIAGRMYGKQINAALVEAWYEFMGDVTPDEGAVAMRGHVCDSPHFPTVADIRKRVAFERIGPTDIASAWGEVRRAIQRCGRDREPGWSCWAIGAAVEAIGWRELCNTLNDELPTVRAQWERYYKASLESQTKRLNAGALEEHIELEQQKRIGPKSTQELMVAIKAKVGGE